MTAAYNMTIKFQLSKLWTTQKILIVSEASEALPFHAGGEKVMLSSLREALPMMQLRNL